MERKRIIGIIVIVFLIFALHGSYDSWSEIFEKPYKKRKPVIKHKKVDLLKEVFLDMKWLSIKYMVLYSCRMVFYTLTIYSAYYSTHSLGLNPDPLVFSQIEGLLRPMDLSWLCFLVAMSNNTDSRVTSYTHEGIKTVTFHQPITVRFKEDDENFKAAMAVVCSHATIAPMEKYQRNTLSKNVIASIVGFSSSYKVNEVIEGFKVFNLEWLRGFLKGGMLSKEAKERTMEYLKEDMHLNDKQISKKLTDDGFSNVTPKMVRNSLKSIDFNKLRPNLLSQFTGEKMNHDLIHAFLRMLERSPSETSSDHCIKVSLKTIKDQYCQFGLKKKIKKKLPTWCKKMWPKLSKMQPQMEDRLKSCVKGKKCVKKCPHCKDMNITIKETKTRSIKNVDGVEEEVSLTSYRCHNEYCSTKTFTLYEGETIPYLRHCKKRVAYAFKERMRGVAYRSIEISDIGDGDADVAPSTHARWINYAAVIMPKWYNVYTPRTSGTVAFDEKFVKNRGEKYYVIIATDVHSFDIIHIGTYKHRTKESVTAFLAEIKSYGFDFDVIITDGAPIYREPTQKFFPRAKHVLCILHMGRARREQLKEVFGSYQNEHYLVLKKYIVDIYTSKTPKQFDKRMNNWKEVAAVFESHHGEEFPEIKDFIRNLEREEEIIKKRLFLKKIPRSTNNVERVIQEFEKRYCTMEGFDSLESANSWCKVFQVYFRLRPFYEGKFKGKCPAEILGYNVGNIKNWTDYIIPPVEFERRHSRLNKAG